MLIGEFVGIDIEDILHESDEYMLKSMLDMIILNIKDDLSEKSNVRYTLDGVINELNKRSTSVYIDNTDDDFRNNIIQAFEKQGLTVERGSGNISLEASSANADQETDAEQEQEIKSAEIGKKAMNNVKTGADSERDGEL